MSLATLCINTVAQIYRPTMTVDSHGGYTPVSGNSELIYADVPNSLQPASGKLIEEFARRSMTITHTMYTPTPIVLKAGDIVSAGNQLTFIVVWFEDSAGRGRVFAAHLLLKD